MTYNYFEFLHLDMLSFQLYEEFDVCIDEFDLNMDDKDKFVAKITLKMNKSFIEINNNYLIKIYSCR